jgi:hypothetical protein
MTIIIAHTKGRRSSKGRKFNPPPWRPRRGRLAMRAPPFSIAQILAWADAYHEHTARWPKHNSGRIAGSLGENWTKVDAALRNGNRGLEGGSSLVQLLSERRGAINQRTLPRLTERQMLAWADAYRERTGKWPRRDSGRIPESLSDKWSTVNSALQNGRRGCPGGSSLAQLLSERRGVVNYKRLPRLKIPQILAWADECHERTGSWPKKSTGRIAASLGEDWAKVDNALRNGLRGFQGGSSLAQLLNERRGVRNQLRLPRLTERQILTWADAHHERSGKWPRRTSGLIEGTRDENWNLVDRALRDGSRGLKRDSSLARLLKKHRGVRHQLQPPALTERLILGWADAHFQRTGRWPKHISGAIPEAPGESWGAIHSALYVGRRGFPGGSSLADLLMARRGVRNNQNLPRLTIERILQWADEHFERRGKWPAFHSGPVLTATTEHWSGIGRALRLGLRGLPSGTTLHDLLIKHRRIKVRVRGQGVRSQRSGVRSQRSGVRNQGSGVRRRLSNAMITHLTEIAQLLG